MDFIKNALIRSDTEILVADFASGEHDRVPSFFTKILPELLGLQNSQTIVYSIDLHALRLDSLLGKLEEQSLLESTRVVQAKLETMTLEAAFRPDLVRFLKDNPFLVNGLDRILLQDSRIPDDIFDIGVLNTDVVGYLHEYYTEYSNALAALRRVHSTIKETGLLIVTNPCSLYVVDNVKVLESVGFTFVEGIDIDLASGKVSQIAKKTRPESMSRLNHYSFLVFSKK